MLFQSQGIVLKTIPYSETSIIAKIYTEAFGFQSYILKGARRMKSNFPPALLQPLTIIEISGYHKENKTLNILKEIKISFPYTSIPFDAYKISVIVYLQEFLLSCIKEEEGNKGLFQFIYSFLRFMDLSDYSPNVILIFMIRLSAHLGFGPQKSLEQHRYFDLQEGCFTPVVPASGQYIDEPYSRELYLLLDNNIEKIYFEKINKYSRKILLEKLNDYYRIHISNFTLPRSHYIFEEVFSN